MRGIGYWSHPRCLAAVGNLGGADPTLEFAAFQFPTVTLAAFLAIPPRHILGVCLLLPPFPGAPVAFAALLLTAFVIGTRLIVHRPEALDGVLFPLLVLNAALLLAAFLRRSSVLLTPFGPVPAEHIRRRHLLFAAVAVTSAIITTTIPGAALIRFGEFANLGFYGFFGKICHYRIIAAI